MAFTRATTQEAADIETHGPLARIRARFEEQNARYYELRQDQQSVNDSLKREDTIRQQIGHLERQQADLERLEVDVANLARKRKRRATRSTALATRSARYVCGEVEAINTRHSDVIILAAEQGVRSPGYADKLGALLKGSNLRNQAEVVKDLAEKIRPFDLVDIVEKSDAGRPATAWTGTSGR